jgi:predicted phosphodiesterase
LEHHIDWISESDRKIKSQQFLDQFIGRLPDVDIFVIAGDFVDLSGSHDLADNLIYFAKQVKKPIVYVPGNHEYYNCQAILIWNNRIKVQEFAKNVHWLNRNIYQIDDVIFAGSTLWFPKRAETDLLKRNINDFTCIPNYENWVYDENHQDEQFFIRQVKEQIYCNNKKLVCVSHHLPCSSVIPDKWSGDRLNIFFNGSDILHNHIGSENLIWLCGHSHEAIYKTLGNTLVVGNPYGYYDGSRYNNQLIIEVN